MKYIVMSISDYSLYERYVRKNEAISNAKDSCMSHGSIVHVLKCVATITPKGVTVDDHEKEEV